MNQEIEYGIKNVYGKETLYVTSCHAKFISALTGKKTIDKRDIENLCSLGFSFTQINIYTHK